MLGKVVRLWPSKKYRNATSRSRACRRNDPYGLREDPRTLERGEQRSHELANLRVGLVSNWREI